MPDPVRINVYWHQACGEGAKLAGAIFNWFRGDPGDPTEAGRGIPVHYRSLPEEPPGSALAVARAPTETDSKPRRHIAVVLVDENMVLDIDWRRHLAALAADGRVQLVIPVALDASAYELPASVSRLNYLRLERALDPQDWSWQRRDRIRRERLLSLLTEVVARDLLPLSRHALEDAAPTPPTEPVAPPRIQVFISHAKADGARQAEVLRRSVLDRGQLQAFYDESDLPIAYPFQPRLDAAADAMAGTQAMLAVYTDAYPSRPWCQRELRLARRPQRLGQQGAAARCWRVKPLVVVADLNGAETRMLGEVGLAPLLAWGKDGDEDGTRAHRILDTLLREVLLLRYNEVKALQLLRRLDPQDAAAGKVRHALNVLPDLHAATEILRCTHGDGGGLHELLIPPPGIDKDSRDLIEGVLSVGGPRVRIRTFDEVELDRP